MMMMPVCRCDSRALLCIPFSPLSPLLRFPSGPYGDGDGDGDVLILFLALSLTYWVWKAANCSSTVSET